MMYNLVSTLIYCIEIRYAPGGDENVPDTGFAAEGHFIEIRYAPGGDENRKSENLQNLRHNIEIRYAPGGDENFNTSTAELVSVCTY